MKQLKKHELNFYTRFTAKAEKAKANHKKLMKAMPFIVIALIVSGVFLYFQLQINLYTGMIAKEKKIYEDEQNISAAAEVDIYNEKSDLYAGEAETLAELKKIQSSYPVNGSKEIKKIFACAENSRVAVNNISINTESGIIDLVGNVASESYIPSFIRKLKDTEMFSYVYYEGYSGSGEKNNTGSYSFNVQMRRKAVFDSSEFEDYYVKQDYYEYDDEYSEDENY